MANFVKDPGTIPHTPGSNVTAGDVILKGEKICVAKLDILAGILGTLATLGIFDFPATDTTVYAVGAKVFWDVADQEATEDEDTGINRLIGYVTVALGSGTGQVVRCNLVDDVA